MYANYKYLAKVSDQLSRASDTSREIPKHSPKYVKHYQIHVRTTYLILILATGPVLIFTSNVQIYLETSSLQRANNVPKLPGLHYVAKKLGTSHGVIVIGRANDYLCYKNLTALVRLILVKFAQKIAMKLPVFYSLFLSEICRQISCEIGQFFLQICRKKSREI